LQADDKTQSLNQKISELREAVSASAAKSELFEVQMFEVPQRGTLGGSAQPKRSEPQTA
jgi:hypothetical protein